MKSTKLKIAGLAMVLGIVSSMAVARPTCSDMERMCAEGSTMWCLMLKRDPACN